MSPENELLQCYQPQGIGPVADHPQYYDIVDRILSGWTSRQIENWLKRQGYEECSWKHIEHYARTYIPDYLLAAPTFIERCHRVKATEIDEMGELQLLIAAQIQRVNRYVEQEQRAIDGGDPVAHSNHAGPEMRLLATLLNQSADMKMKLGILKKVPEEIINRNHIIEEEPPPVLPMPDLRLEYGMSQRKVERLLAVVEGLNALPEGERQDE